MYVLREEDQRARKIVHLRGTREIRSGYISLKPSNRHSLVQPERFPSGVSGAYRNLVCWFLSLMVFWRDRERIGLHGPDQVIQCSTLAQALRVSLIRVAMHPRHNGQSRRSITGFRARWRVAVDKSGRTSHATLTTTLAHMLSKALCSLKPQDLLGGCGWGGLRRRSRRRSVRCTCSKTNFFRYTAPIFKACSSVRDERENERR